MFCDKKGGWIFDVSHNARSLENSRAVSILWFRSTSSVSKASTTSSS